MTHIEYWFMPFLVTVVVFAVVVVVMILRNKI